jgi:hypothetical protein
MEKAVCTFHEYRAMRARPATVRGRKSGRLRFFVILSVFAVTHAPIAVSAETILFVGNSLIYGARSPVKRYGADTVTDLNEAGFGGVPALFKAFTREVGLDYEPRSRGRHRPRFPLHGATLAARSQVGPCSPERQ